MARVVVIGAGVGGLTAAAALARAGMDVTVLEAQVYPGGCAGTYIHQGYRFDAGATLAGGFYPGGPMDLVAQAAGISSWPARAADTAMLVHLPDGEPVRLTSGEERWSIRQAAFGRGSETFWRWQERTADALWQLALQLPPWPPQSAAQGVLLAGNGLAWLRKDLSRDLFPQLVADAFRTVAVHLQDQSERMRLFVDAQLLISAQTTSRYANALYGASALDLPRRGVVHLDGGMGAIAQTLIQALRIHGGKIIYRQEATRVLFNRGLPVQVRTKRGETFPADIVIFNLPAWNILPMLGEHSPGLFKNLPPAPQDGWGAFVAYAGLDGSLISKDFPLHHQVILREPLGEGNSIFLSLSPDWDRTRAPEGHRAATISTHTRLEPWWQLYDQDREAYEARKAAYTEKLLAAAEAALPGLRQSAHLVLPGTPVTFQRFTRRAWGWVGGFPQTSLFRALGPRLGRGLWMVGESIFPGQSTAAVALGGLRVAEAVLMEYGKDSIKTRQPAQKSSSLVIRQYDQQSAKEV